MTKTKKKPQSIKKSPPVSKKLAHILALANILWFVVMIVINYQAVNLPIGGMTTGQLADLYPNLFTPAGLTFSIRGLIYLALFGFVIRQMIDLSKKKSHNITQKIWPRFLLSCATNIGWIFAWHYQQVALSMLILIAFLIIVIVIGYKVQLGQKLWTRKEKLLVQVPFSLYQWRLSVAVIANIAARLVHIGWGMRGMNDIFRTILVIIVAALLALRKLKKQHNIIFALVVLRAFLGIIIKRVSIDPIYASSIIWTLGVCMVLISTGIGLQRNKRVKN